MRVTIFFFFFFSSRRRHTRLQGDWSSDVCSSDLPRGLLRLCPRRRHPAVRLRDERPPDPTAPDDRGSLAGQSPRRNGIGIAEARPLADGPLRSEPLFHVDPKFPEEREERFRVEVLR